MDIAFKPVARPVKETRTDNPFIDLAGKLAADKELTLGFEVELPTDADAQKSLIEKIKRQLGSAGHKYDVTISSAVTIAGTKTKPVGEVSAWARTRVKRTAKVTAEASAE